MDARFKVAMTLAFAAVLAGCSRHNNADDDNGRIISVDKSTGVLTVTDGDKIVKVKTPEEQIAEDRRRDDLAKPKDMRLADLRAMGGGTAALRIYWRDDKVYYRLVITIASEELASLRNESSASFEVSLLDAAGAVVRTIEVPASPMVLNRPQTGKEITLTREDSAACAEDDYSRVTDWSISSRGIEAE
jgi:hypothetical protein